MSNTLESLLPRTERVTLADQVYADIKQLLLSGMIPPGQKVTLRGLAGALGTSPMPVRDAVARLVNEGALEMLPNRSLRVFKPRLSEFLEIVKLRCCLEGFAAYEAAANMTPARLRKIEDYARRYYKLAHQKKFDTQAIVEANRALHFTVYEAAEMPRLVNLIENIWTQIGSMFALSMSTEKRDVSDWESFHHHERLITALKAGDFAAARDAVADDIRDASVYIQNKAKLKD